MMPCLIQKPFCSQKLLPLPTLPNCENIQNIVCYGIVTPFGCCIPQVQRLLDEGADVNAPAWGPKAPGTTPLHLAATGGHLHVMDELLERGANIEARTKGGCGCKYHGLFYSSLLGLEYTVCLVRRKGVGCRSSLMSCTHRSFQLDCQDGTEL